MLPFRRAIRLIFLVFGVFIGMVTVIVAYLSRMMISPPRQALWATPADLGMAFEEVQFPARDGIRLSGWFIPAAGLDAEKKTTLILVHGWPWNRLGTTAETLFTDLPGSAPLQLLHLSQALNRLGFNILMFDLRNHGQSASSIPVTFGLRESNDLLGALDHLEERQDVDSQRIGVIGFSTGANTLLFALPRTDLIRAAIAVQPTSTTVFSSRYATSLLGPFGRIPLAIASMIYQAVGGLRLSAIEPIFAASGSSTTPVLYIQGTGDRWGSVENVADMVRATPNALEPIYVETGHRFDGYQYVVDNPDLLQTFFEEQIG